MRIIALFIILFSATVITAQIPTAPTRLFCNIPTDTSVTCSFIDNSNNETNFIVETKIGWLGTYTTTTTLSANTTAPHVTFNLSGLTPQKVYYIRVKATNGSGSSSYLLEKYIETRYPIIPIAPSSFSCVAQNYNFISCTWNDNSFNEYDFRLERKVGAGSFSEIAIISPNKTFYYDNSVSASTSYTYRIRARWKSVVTATTISGLPLANNSAGLVYVVTDAANSNTCSTAGGSTRVACHSNGSSWDVFQLRPIGMGSSTEEYSNYSNESAISTGTDTTNTETNFISNFGAQAASGSEGTKPLGTKILTGSKPIEIIKGCRWKAAGNDEAHDVFIEAYVTNGRGTELARVTFSSGEISAASVGNLCKNFPTKITLAPNTQYIIGSDETATDNQFSLGNDIGGYGPNSAVAQDAITYNGSRWIDITIGANHGFGQSFTYDLISNLQATNPPTNLRAITIYPDKIQIAWDSEATDNTGYEVDRCQGAGCSSFSLIESPTNKTHISTSLSSSTIYRYRIRSTIGGTTDSANTSIVDISTTSANNYYVNTGGQFQTVLNSGTTGKIILVEAGAIFDAPDTGYTASTDCLSSRCFVKTTNTSSLPSARVSWNDESQMFKLFTGGDTAIDITGNNWTFDGVVVTTSEIKGGSVGIKLNGQGNYLDHSLIIPYYFRSYYWERNIPVAVALNKGTLTNPNMVLRSYIYGFYGDQDGSAMATEAIKSNELDGGVVYDCMLNAGFVMYFGGGEGSNAVAGFQGTVTEQGTGPSGTVTSFKVSNITNLRVGMVISVGQGSGGWGTGDQFGASARVASINISTNLITLDEALTRDRQNPPTDIGGQPGTANVGDVVRWRSTRVRNIHFLASTIFTDPWNSDDNQAHGHGTKGYIEVKDTKGLYINGCRFHGFDQALTLTSGNQNGNNVSHNVEDVQVENNFFGTYSAIAGIVLRDPYKRAYAPANWNFINNLLVVESRNRIVELPGALTAANSPGNYRERETHYGLNFKHNTFMTTSSAEFPGIVGGTDAMKVVNEVNPTTENIYGLEVSDNIFAHWTNGFKCTNNTNIECLRGRAQTDTPIMLKNLVMNPNGATTQSFTDDYTTNGYLTPIPTTKSNLGMYNLTDFTPHGFRLNPSNSVYENLASDGTDPGTNIDTLLAALEMSLPSDVVLPTGNITAPLGGQVLTPLSGSVTFSASVSDNIGVTSVEFVVDNTRIALDSSAPYTTSFNTSSFSSGLHTLRAIVTDNTGLTNTLEYEFVNFGIASPIKICNWHTNPTCNQ